MTEVNQTTNEITVSGIDTTVSVAPTAAGPNVTVNRGVQAITVSPSAIASEASVGMIGPQGPQGPIGLGSATVAVGTTTTGAAGSSASVVNSGTTTAAILDFTIPRGAQGFQGPQGPQGSVGSTGATGAQGSQGPQGPTGSQGSQGPQGSQGAQGILISASPPGDTSILWADTGSTGTLFAPGRLSTNAQTGSSYTLVLDDEQKLIECNYATAFTLNVPLNSSVAYVIGTQINLLQSGAGQVTITPAGGVTINGTPGLKTRAQWSAVTLIKRGTDTWVAVGDLSA